MARILYVVASLVVAVSAQTRPQPNAGNSDTGNWKVGNCIIAQFAMEFKIFLNASDKADVMKVDVPEEAKANGDQSNCKNDTQTLNLTWKTWARNDSSTLLWRNLTVIFEKKKNESYYGVRRFYAEFEMAKFVSNATNATSSLQIDSKELDKLMLLTPLDRSYLCANIDTVSLHTSLNYDIPNTVPTVLNNTLLTAKHVQFDAFRPADHAPSGFRTPMDCDYQPNDIIPIAVGVSLAGLVVAILIAYMVGRRRQRQRGYQSV